ncbi:zinc-dependent metalloprotease [Pseudofulvibacter geojedonensis]|uniref:M43 family zinc metalloprotease n=1 Tax=Pseudofulvibacter geojedonensis TaxID=1123758 RepID=A0ABW3I4Y7_9FLAO
MKRITLLSLFMTLFAMSSLLAQNETQRVHDHRTCGMEQHMRELLQNPDFAREYARRQAAFNVKYEEIKTQKANGTYERRATLYIPVAVHFPTGSESDRSCLEAHAQTQIDVINADYTKTNADHASNWAAAQSHYPNTTPGSVDVKFCIATKNHPTVSPAIADGNLAVTIGSQSGSYASTDVNTTWAGYMNFVIKNAGDGILGYSPLGGSISGGQCVVMNFGSYGTGSGCTGFVPQAPYNLGRTVTHELGHFYNLDHTFNGGCTGPNDNVADTPAVANATYGTPAPGSVAGCVAGEKALTMNYMDYVNDSHMYMFSAGQATRMEAYFATVASDWKQNVLSCQSPDFTVTANNSPVAVCAGTDPVFNFTFATTNGYNATTNLSVSAGLPAGATATFNPTSMNADGNFTLTLTGSIAAGNYPMTISAAGTTTKTVDVVLNVSAGTPAVPTLTSPANGATNQPLATTLTWGASANSSTYTVQTATDAAFTANVTTNSVSATTYNATGLNSNTQYFWRVKAVNGCGESAYSSVFNFTTATVNCNDQTNSNSVAIPNSTANGTEAAPGVSTITIAAGNNVNITDVNVTIDITYEYINDLRVELEHPDGTKIDLIKNIDDQSGPGAGNHFTQTVLDDAGTTAITAGTAPFTGTFSPENPLNVLNGKTSQGDWKLNVYDQWTDSTGTINSFKLEICGNPVLSIEDDIFADSFAVWPNPNNGNFNIAFNNVNKEAISVELYDIRGRKIFNQEYTQNSSLFNQSFNFNNLDSAIYILKVRKGTKEINKRILIK